MDLEPESERLREGVFKQINVGALKTSCCGRVFSPLPRRQRNPVNVDNNVLERHPYLICYPPIYIFFLIDYQPARWLTLSHSCVIISLPYTQGIAGDFSVQGSYAEIPDLSGVGMRGSLFSH